MAPILSLIFAAAAASQPVTRLKWANAPQPWVVFLCLALAAVLCLYLYSREEGTLSARARGVLAVLRFSAIALALAILWRPVLVTERIEKREGYTAVLIDDSLSMSFKDRYSDPKSVESLRQALGSDVDPAGLSRMDVAKRSLLNPKAQLLEAFARRNTLRVYTYSEVLNPLGEAPKTGEPGDPVLAEMRTRVAALEPEGRFTATGDALTAVRREFQGRRLAAVVLYSDGRSNGGAVLPETAAAALARRGVPVHAVGVGNPAESKDIALSNLHASEAVLVGDYVPFDVVVKQRGYDGEILTLRLYLNDTEVAREDVVLGRASAGEAGSDRQDVRLTFRPDRAGEFECRVVAEEKPGEMLEENNVQTHPLRVLDDKLRILYVEGYPRWEYRYLKTALIRDRTMEVQCLLLSADPEFHQEHSEGVEPLTAFPGDRESLFKYHVVLLGDVDLRDPRWFSQEKLELLREFVQSYGGGLLFQAGEQYVPASVNGTALEPLLPVTVDTHAAEDVLSVRVRTQSFNVRITPEGREDPLLRLVNDADLNRRLWEGGGPEGAALPGFFWHYAGAKAKPGARVLATHPDGDPIFTLLFYGGGRCFFSAVDSTWRWRAGVEDRYFYRFWGQVIRFLGMGKLLGRTQRYGLSTDKSEYAFGDPVNVSLRVLDREFQPSEEPEQKLHVQAPDGTLETLPLPLRPERPGVYEGVFTAGRIGTYHLWVGDPDPSGEKLAEKSFEVQVPILELTDPTMDREALGRIALASGGSFRTVDQVAGLAELIPEIVEPIPSDVSEREVWDTWWMLLLLVGVLTVEWVLRKFFHLL